MSIRDTHTVVELDLPQDIYDHIAERLREAGYDHCFDGDMIDMTGIAIVPASPPVGMTTYTTQPGESVAGIALRQLGDENAWKRILACNPKFHDLLAPDYFPVGTVLVLPKL